MTDIPVTLTLTVTFDYDPEKETLEDFKNEAIIPGLCELRNRGYIQKATLSIPKYVMDATTLDVTDEY